MAEQSPSIDVLEKEIDWSSTIGVTMPVSGAEVYQRVERITPNLLENGVLRIEAVLKLFAVVTTVQDQKHVFKPARVFTKDVEINSFITLHNEITRDDIISIEHQEEIKNHVLRPDNINVSGVLRLKISYAVHLVLDGTVTDFATGAPLNGATINVMHLENRATVASASTGSNGRYFFKNLPPGIYLLEALNDTHKPEQKVSVIKNRDTVNFVLHK